MQNNNFNHEEFIKNIISNSKPCSEEELNKWEADNKELLDEVEAYENTFEGKMANVAQSIQHYADDFDDRYWKFYEARENEDLAKIKDYREDMDISIELLCGVIKEYYSI